MRLRKLKQHFLNQEWMAVSLDLVIVILGVFLGLQLGNWNSEKEQFSLYQNSQQRLLLEIRDNLTTLAILDKESKAYISIVSAGFEALINCDTSQEKAIIGAINASTGTYGVSLRTEALDHLLHFKELQGSEYENLRNTANDAKWFVDLSLREANMIETLPMDFTVMLSPAVTISAETEEKETQYAGNDYTRKVRQLKLAMPIEQACKDEQLLKALYQWERWQGFLPRLIDNLKERHHMLEQALVEVAGNFPSSNKL